MNLVLPLPSLFCLSFLLPFCSLLQCGGDSFGELSLWSAGSRKGEGTAFSDDDTEDTGSTENWSQKMTIDTLAVREAGRGAFSSECGGGRRE
ncbi:hypothetical protein MUK42_14266 [Musa troglodytarum]|uniref:Secreted protein n=2 Tax=Musa troglodytarum TaxID=320322 RepID=A0A9E7H517_9LILI|nr:hypothetical protein MUK42_14266 [Musa troglodytarum]URE24883.1 hypothetical protein MUK42_14266 [Musa troglodytarum]